MSEQAKQVPAKYVVISIEGMQKIADYLATQPYKDVAEMMSIISEAKPVNINEDELQEGPGEPEGGKE